MTHTILLDEVNPTMLLSINEQNRKGHWHRKRCVDYWHGLIVVAVMAADGLPPVLKRARITVTFRFPTRRVRDTANLYPVAKACVDALVTRFEILPGDDDRYLIGPDLRRDPENGPHRVVVHIEDLSEVAP